MSLQNLKSSTTGSAPGQTTSNAWNQLGQLLTCAICLDRYRNPKLLPCQHTFCMEPCMDGLVDYVRRQVKCPECRAEHRIPYQGIQGFPTSVTLMRFLELHCEVTGEVPDPPSAMMERCGVCTEKSYVGPCAHCEKKVCSECKEAHLDIMKREITRINTQVRRGLNRLQDALSQVVKSSLQLQSNCGNIVVEIEEVYRRLQKELKDREETLKAEVATFLQGELRNAEQLKEGLQMEVANIESNAELAEKHVAEKNDWDDVELMEYKDTFLRTLEFLRNFDPDQADFNRRLKFQLGPEPETTHHTLANLGELIISAPNFPGSCVTSAVGMAGSGSSGNGTGGGLMRSKSEHRLASSASSTTMSSSQSQRHSDYLAIMQRAGHGNSDTEGRSDGRSSSPLTRRRTGELADGTAMRRGRDLEDNDRSSYGSRRYGREYGSVTESTRSGYQRGGDDNEYSGYRSRFAARDGAELQRDNSDGDITTSRSVRFARQHQEAQHTQEVIGPRERVFETEDATRGPLSGIIRLMDSPRVMERIHQHGQRLKQQQQQAKVLQAQALTVVQHTPTPIPTARQRTARQVSEDDEIAKQKAANKSQSSQGTVAGAAQSPPPAATPVSAQSPPPPVAVAPTRPSSRRALQREESTKTSNDERSESDSQSSHRRNQYGTRSDEVEAPRKPASRQASRDTTDAAPAEVKRPPSRQASTESSSSHHERSATGSESVTKEDDSSLNKRFYNRTTGDAKQQSITKSNIPVAAPISESLDSESDSETETKTPTPQVGGSAATPVGHPISLEDIQGVEKPNYFRYRSAQNYSRTPSNSSLNSQDESGRGGSGALSPTRPQSPPFTARAKPNVAPELTKAKERTNSTDSSESSSSESATNATTNRVPLANQTNPTPVLPPAATADKKDTRYTPFRSRETTDSDKKVAATAAKDTASNSTPSGRLSSLGTAGRTSSLDKRDDSATSKPETNAKPRFVSRFLPRKDDTDSDSDSDIDSRPNSSRKQNADDVSSPISALLARSANARRDNHTANSSSTGSARDKTDGHYGSTTAASGRSSYGRDQRDDVSSSSSRRTGVGSGSSYGLQGRDESKKDSDTSEGRYSSLASKYLTRSRPSLCDVDDRDDSKYVSYGSRYLSKSKSSAALSFDKDDLGDDLASSRRSSIVGGADRYKKETPSSSRYSAARRSRLGRSKSSHELNGGEEEDDDDDKDTSYGGRSTTSAATSHFERPSEYLASKSRSQHALHSREQSPDESATATGSSSLSSWARYLKTKYGNKAKDKSEYQPIGRSRSSHALYSREASSESSEEETESPLMHDSTWKDSTVSYSPGYAGLNSSRGGGSENTRSAYQQKRKVMMKIGARGSEQGRFTWPRGIAVGPDNCIVVADSSNHRVQVFDAQGSFCKEFGAYGSAEGEFDCLAGVAVNRIGQYIISDRYNHRIQIFDPSGRFLRTFGCQGSVDGKLSYPWGIATDSLGFIYVCDKENHRVQVFQSDGTFVGKFGSLGNKAGQMEHPHYIAVSSTNKVVVSDSNNHRIQIFDVNGRVLSTFGGEGTDEGQFKFPRGVAVDDQGYIIVGDSGNNRIQVFLPDGTFLKSFGVWGSGDGEFKGLEGVAVTSSGSILVCDRENHRIQIF